ncbi:MAG TPA: GNAT family N-acetyltransferase [Dehalococcoidia bacterium]|nr:GNAT family N-acetyltransferase [Dehalococcoidia bacterium]
MAHRIRPMLSSDKATLHDILNTIPEFSSDDVLVAREVIDNYLRDPAGSGYNVLVAEIEKDVVAYICYGPTPLTKGTWDIYWMATLPEKQGHGIGSDLLGLAESKIVESGGRLIMIETSSRSDYEKALHFHQNHCYEVICRLSDFYAPGDDKLILQKKLGR